MSKWGKSQGVVVPLESLLKERRKENCPAPRRSAGLVGRWGITSFTSIRNRGYVVDYSNVNPKEPGLEIASGDSPEGVSNMLGSPVAEVAKPRKFFKSRTVLPPLLPPGEHHGFGTLHPTFDGVQGALPADVWSSANVTPPQHFYQQQQQYPMSAATPQLSPTGPQSANVGLLPSGAAEGMMDYGAQAQAVGAIPPVKEKAPRKKRASSESSASRKPAGRPPGKKEKKERKPKRSKKDTVEAGNVAAAVGPVLDAPVDAGELQPKRNSSRIRKRVVNYNEEEEDSNDYERTKMMAARQQLSHGTPDHGVVPAADPSFLALCDQQQQDPHVSTADAHLPPKDCMSFGDGSAESFSSGDGRTASKTVTPSCMPSPSISEHRPILLRISKGTSMLITDNEDLSSNDHPLEESQSAAEPDATFAPAEENYPEAYASALTTPAAIDNQRDFHPYLGQHLDDQTVHPSTTENNVGPSSSPAAGTASSPSGFTGVTGSDVSAPKSELKIKISLGGKPLISSTTGVGAVTGTNAATGGKSKSSSKYNFKKRAIERERARHHQFSTKRNKAVDAAATADPHFPTIDGAAATEEEEEGEGEESGKRWASQSNSAVLSTLPPPLPPPVSSSTVSSPNYGPQQQQQQNRPHSTADTIGSTAGEATGVVRGAAGGAASSARHSFPLPGTDTYEVFRTLSSLSGGDDFDSQSSILGSASSDNNTPKHTLQASGEDCQIIHSRGSSDCGSDLELSQNSSTAAAPPSDVYSENENTQDNNQHHQQQQHLSSSVNVVGSSGRSLSASLPPSTDLVSTSSIPAGFEPRPVERVEVLKLSIMHSADKNGDNSSNARRVTRNKTKHGSSAAVQPAQSPDQHQQKQQHPSSAAAPEKQTKHKAGRMVRSRNNNNNNNNNTVVGSTVSDKRPRNPHQDQHDGGEATATAQASVSRQEAYEALLPNIANAQPGAQSEADDALNYAVESSTGPAVKGTLEAPSSGPKPSVTRQYSRKKKNVVPPDYLVAADTTGGGGRSSALSIGLSTPALQGSSEPFDGTGEVLAAERQQGRPNGSVSETLAQQSNHASASNEMDDSKRTHLAMSLKEKTTPMFPTDPSAGGTPPAPMRLVLQKKGTIFKSRPLVGSSEGVTETKKRHVYKHKWDDDGAANSDPAMGAGGAAGAGGGLASDGSANGGAACGGVGSGFVISSTGGVSGTVGNCPDAGALQGSHHHPAGDGGRGDAAGDDGVGGSHNGGPSAVGIGGGGGAGGLEYDNDFDFESASALPGMVPRSKRPRTGPNTSAGSGAASVASSGVAGSTSSGSSMGAGAFGHHSHNYLHEYDTDGGGFHDERQDFGGADDFGGAPKLRCERNAKPFYTIVRNVKNSHQMQEIGEFQEMDDDVEYILSALQPDNPTSTRCLSALQLATKCMKPAFKMHVRAHGVVTRFFKALSDAYQDASLGLCTAAIMFVFSQDKLNMDLDRDSLELMLNLLNTDHRADPAGQMQGQGQLPKIRQRVKELCEEIKGAGKAKHIDTDHVTAGSLALESLLSLTSQRAGEWFKDELRNLGGIQHLIKTVAECYHCVPAQVSDWDEEVVARLRKIERCLRVLNNVCLFNNQNQRFLLEHRAGLLVQLLVKMYRQVDANLMRYPTSDASPKESTAVVLREMLQPILHMLITLTHSFDEEAQGAHLVGKQPEVIKCTMHLLLRIAEYIPHRCVFDLHLLVLTLLLHLARPSQHNRQQVLQYRDEETSRGGIKALAEYFEAQEEMASHAEAKTNAILETPARTVDAEDAETKLMQKAEHHMEHTYMGSHVGMLIYHLVLNEPTQEQIARMHLKNNDFRRMVAAMNRYYEFLNLTTNADAESTAHKRQTKEAIDYLRNLDDCESGAMRGSKTDPMAVAHLVGE